MNLRRLAAIGLALALAGPVLAQQQRKQAAPAKPPVVEKPAEPAPPADGAPPYEGQLMRLSEIMGALAWLRGVCGDGDGADYRAKMSALLDADATTPERKEKLAGAYNRGYRGYEATYRVCTPNARLVIERYVAEGGRIAHEISYRFGGS